MKVKCPFCQNEEDTDEMGYTPINPEDENPQLLISVPHLWAMWTPIQRQHEPLVYSPLLLRSKHASFRRSKHHLNHSTVVYYFKHRQGGHTLTVLDIKPEARILDATAANRRIWDIRETPNIIWLDIDPELEIKPDVVIDCTKTEFPDGYFFAIFFDPPHQWGDKTADQLYTCRNKKEHDAFMKKWGFKQFKKVPTYYGTDKYKSKSQLLSFIHKAQQEFYRILAPNGMLWVKWCESKIPLGKITPFFKDWHVMMVLEIGSQKQTLSQAQTFWILLLKDSERIEIPDLSVFMTKSDQEGSH